MNERGYTLVEMLMVLAILVVFGTLSVPHIRAYSSEAHLLGAGQVFRGEFRKARSMAAMRGVYTAIRFESQPDGWHTRPTRTATGTASGRRRSRPASTGASRARDS